MDDALVVRVLHRFGERRRDAGGCAGFQRSFGQMLLQTLPVDEAHRKEVLAVGFTHFVDGNNVGVIELGRRLGLGVKASHFFIAGELAAADHLQRNDPPQPHLPGPVDDPHPATGDFVEQFVIAERLLPNGRRFLALRGGIRSRPVVSRRLGGGDRHRHVQRCGERRSAVRTTHLGIGLPVGDIGDVIALRTVNGGHENSTGGFL